MQSIFLSDEEREIRNKSVSKIALLIVIGIAVNYVGEAIAGVLNVPFYLDCIGTVFVAAISGTFPGVFVGLISNILKMFDDSSSMYYSSLNVLIAFCTSEFKKRGWFKSLKGKVLFVFLLAAIGGGLGGLLTWMLYGKNSTQISSGYAAAIYDNFLKNRMLAELLASFIIDLGDKIITVIAAYILVSNIPADWRRRFKFDGWQQRPLTKQARDHLNDRPCRKTSLKVKLVFVLLAASVALALISVGISYALYRSSIIDMNTRFGSSIAKMAESVIDPDRIDDYLEYGEEAEGYLQTKKVLKIFADSSEDIEYVYVYRILEDGCHVVFDMDTEDLKGSVPGTVVEFDESFMEYLPALLAGESIEPIVSNDKYGWLLTVYVPVYDSEGHCQCYAAADISMSDLKNNMQNFIVKMLSLFLGFFVLVVSVGLWIADYNVILPVNTIAAVANDFAYNSEVERDESVVRIRDLDIRTGDEIENLYHAILKLAADTMRQLGQITEKSRHIENLQHSMILVLADMVESRDENTGQHVRKTSAYVEIIIEELRREGLFSDQLTDEFAEDVIHSAPLHDIGKITIPDAILNKPGRLNDDEFMIMRSHAAAGRDIISNIIEMVPDSQFLKEARNLAAHHHERWDGKGYPDGLSGEDIPLSARIMAVADVFDALVSTRSYKKGFPFEKAISIIEEGIGTQFDPQVARAFLNISDKARNIAENFEETLEEKGSLS